MKKKKLSITLALASGILLLSSCGKKDFEEQKVFDKAMLEENLDNEKEIEKEEESSVLNHIGTVQFKTTDSLKVYSDSYYQHGLIITQNAAGYIGFYSLHYNTHLVAPMYHEQWIQSLNVFTNQNIGYFIRVQYEDVYTIYDSLGNTVYKGDKELDVETNLINNKVYLSLFDSEKEEMLHYEYQADSSLQKIVNLPIQMDKEIVDDEKEDDLEEPLKFGDIFVGNKLDLTDFGMAGSYIVNSNNLYTVFNENDVKVSTFALPEDVVANIIGGQLIYQIYTALPDEVEDYSFSRLIELKAVKYDLKTYSIDLKTGEKFELECEYIIENSLPYKDSLGVYKYGLSYIRKIGDHKELMTGESYLIDADGHLVQNLTGYEVKYFTRLNENYYYNMSTKVIYDSSLNEIAYLSDMNPQRIKDANLFIGKMNGKYGAVGYDGKVLVPFEYNSLAPLENASIDIKDNYIIASKSVYDEEIQNSVTQYYRVDLNNGTSKFLGNNISVIYDDLYLVKTGVGYKYISQDKDYSVIELDSIYNENDYNKYYTFSANYNNTKYIFSKTYDETSRVLNTYTNTYDIESTTTYNIFNINKYPKTNFTTIGTEITEDIHLGVTLNDTYSMAIGTNDILVAKENNYSYSKFTPTADGKYVIKSNDKLILIVYDKYGNTVDITNSTITAEFENEKNQYFYRFDLMKDETYTFRFIIDETENHYAKYELYMSKYETEDSALVLDLQNPSAEVNLGEFDYFYVKIPKFELSSSFTTPANFKVSVGTNALFDVGKMNTDKVSYNYSTGLSNYTVNMSSSDTYLRVYYSSSNTTDNISISLTSLNENVIEGSSIFTAKKLNSANQFTMPYDSTPIYYSYTNNTTKEQLVSLDIKSYRSGSTVSYQSLYYAFFDEEYKLIGNSSSNNSSSVVKNVFLKPNEKIYVALKNSYSSYSADVTINVTNVAELTGEVQIASYQELKFSQVGTYYYKFTADKYADINGYENTLSYLGGTGSVSYFDKNYNVVNLSNMDSGVEYYAMFKANTITSAPLLLTYSLTPNVKTYRGSIEEDVTASYQSNFYKYSNTTNKNMVVMVDTEILSKSTYTYPLSGTAYINIVDENGKVITSAYATQKAKLIVQIPANTTYFISVYSSYYNSSYPSSLRTVVTELPNSTSKSMAIEYGEYAYQVFTCEETATYRIATSGMDLYSQTLTLQIMNFNELSTHSTASNSSYDYEIVKDVKLYKGETYVLQYYNGRSSSAYTNSFTSTITKIK